MSLKGWAELIHEQRLNELATMNQGRRKEQIAKWIEDDGISDEKAKELWGDYQDLDTSSIITKAIQEKEQKTEEAERFHRYEYEVVNMNIGDDATRVINDYAKKGWRLHTYSQAALDGGGFRAGFLKAFGGPGLSLVNLLTLVFERDRRGS